MAGLTPITREEQFLAKAGGMDVQTPNPISRRELFLQKIIDNMGGQGSGGNPDYVLTAADKEEIAEIAAGLVEVPEGSGGGIAVTGATVGQTVKIAAVDENGVPTAWEPVDFPSGGTDRVWRKIADIDFQTLISEGVASFSEKLNDADALIFFCSSMISDNTSTNSGLTLKANGKTLLSQEYVEVKKSGSSAYSRMFLVEFDGGFMKITRSPDAWQSAASNYINNDLSNNWNNAPQPYGFMRVWDGYVNELSFSWSLVEGDYRHLTSGTMIIYAREKTA